MEDQPVASASAPPSSGPSRPTGRRPLGILDYINRRQIWGDGPSLTNSLVSAKISGSGEGKEYFGKDLLSHWGCVNAIEFSADGGLLASGGDDKRILLWNVNRAMAGSVVEPVIFEAEHRSNVFALALTPSKLISGGNDDQVIIHDIETGKPLDFFPQEQPIFGVATDPTNENVFSVAGDDGSLLLLDMRDSAESYTLAKAHAAFHSVNFHPTESRLVLSANSKEGAALWDTRMPKKYLLKYGRGGNPSCMNARFNKTGSQVLCLRRRLPPSLYNTWSQAHLFQFNHSSYYNSATMKSCSFGGAGDEYVMSGSDNFDLHVWKIPPEGSDRWVKQASVLLKGHRSIVNQVRYNYTHHVIATSGVEKMIKLWSPFIVPDGDSWKNGENGRKVEVPRQIYSYEEYVRLYMRTNFGPAAQAMAQDVSRSTIEDSRMLAFFDALVQRDIAGLSEEENDNDSDGSTYTNTVYSPPDSSSDTAVETRDQAEVANDPADDVANNQNQETPVGEERRVLVDFGDLPSMESSDSVDEDLTRVITNRYTGEPEGANNDDGGPDQRHPVASGSSAPNTLTRLIAKREGHLRKLASKKPNPKRKKRSGESAIMIKRLYSSSDDSETEPPESPIQMPSRKKNLQNTPVYESTSHVNNDGQPSNVNVADLMVRNSSPTEDEQPSTSYSRCSTSSSASSSLEAKKLETRNGESSSLKPLVTIRFSHETLKKAIKSLERKGKSDATTSSESKEEKVDIAMNKRKRQRRSSSSSSSSDSSPLEKPVSNGKSASDSGVSSGKGGSHDSEEALKLKSVETDTKPQGCEDNDASDSD